MKNLFILLFLTLSFSGQAQKSEIYTTKSGAINGYDAVAYFKNDKPVKGNPEFTLKWKNSDWYFSNEENLKAFKAAPEKYAPQYGGYCAYGTSKGYKAPTEPDAFTIVNDKLYLNYNTEVKKTWIKDKEGYIEKADNQWLKIKDGK